MNQSPYAKLTLRLRHLSRQILAVRIAGNLSGVLAALVLITGIIAFTESFVYFSPPVKSILFILLWLVPVAMFLLSALISIMNRPGVEETARFVEQVFPVLGDRLISAIQLGRIPGDRLRGQSPELVEALVTSITCETDALDLRRAVPFGGLFYNARMVFVAVILFLGFSAAFPDRMVGGFYRIVDHTRTYTPVDTIRIFTVKHSGRIIEGEDFTVPGFVSGAPSSEVNILYRMGMGQQWSIKPVTPGNSDGDFSAKIEKPRSSFEYYLEVSDASTPVYTVTVIERPVVTSLDVTLSYPDYTGLGVINRNDSDGNIRAIAGTKVSVTVHASKPLSSITHVWADSTAVPCVVYDHTGTVTFDITQSVDYYFKLTDTLGISNTDPVVYRVTALSDEYPTVSILSPGADVVLPGSMKVPVVYRAGDDYGISLIELTYRLPHEENPHMVKLSVDTGTTITGEYLWDLTAMNLLPDDTVPYSITVYDTDTVNGPKRAESETRVIRLPSLTDIFSDAMNAQNEDIDRLREITNRTEEQNRKLDEVNRNIKSGQDLEWSDRNALEDAREDLERMQEETSEVADHIKEMAARLSDEEIVAVETLTRMEKIASIMNEIADGDMKDALMQLTQVNMEVDPRIVKQLLDQYQVTAESIQEKLDRIIALLEQARTIQQFEMAKNLLEEIALRQALLDSKYELEPDNPAFVREERILADEMETIHDSLASAVDSLGVQFGMNIDRAQESLERNDATGTMRETADLMEQQRTPEANAALDETNRRIGELLADMDALGTQMANANSAEMKRRLFTALNQLIAVSDKQESLVGNLKEKDIEKLAQDQLGIMDGLSKADESLSKLGEMIAELAPITGQITASSRLLMESAVQAFTESNRAAGESNAENSLKMLNQSISILTSLLENSGSGSSGQGMPGDLMQMLQAIANGQLDLQRQLSGEQMGQLAAEQAKLSEMLSDLAQKVLEDERLRGMLEQLAREMDETSDMMRRTEPRELVERRQLDIYRRLLDARRSQREKDEAEERTSWTARENVSRGADTLPADLGERELELNRRLDEAMEGDFDPVYKDLIRDYFESLLGDRSEVAQ